MNIDILKGRKFGLCRFIYYFSDEVLNVLYFFACFELRLISSHYTESFYAAFQNILSELFAETFIPVFPVLCMK